MVRANWLCNDSDFVDENLEEEWRQFLVENASQFPDVDLNYASAIQQF